MRRFFLFFIYSAVFIAGVFVSAFIVSKILLREKVLVTVPNIKGKELIDAWQILKNESIELKIDSFRYSEAVPRYVIIEQKPPPGEKIEKKRSVFVVLSLGPQRFFIPDLTGLNFEGAKRLIEEAGLNLKDVFKVHSPKSENEVIGQFPPPGSESPLRDVSILVSKGPSPKNYICPDLNGMDLENIQNLFLSYQIPVKIQYVSPELGEQYRVFQQFPSPGMKISDKDGVEVMIPGISAEGGVIRVKVPYGLLKKFLEININYEDWKMSLFKDMVEGGRVVYFFVPGNGEIEVFLDKKKIF
jgi:beta-lactam-binding protein with PASTA domain